MKTMLSDREWIYLLASHIILFLLSAITLAVSVAKLLEHQSVRIDDLSISIIGSLLLFMVTLVYLIRFLFLKIKDHHQKGIDLTKELIVSTTSQHGTIESKLSDIEEITTDTNRKVENIRILISENDKQTIFLAEQILSFKEESIRFSGTFKENTKQILMGIDIIQDYMGIPYTRSQIEALYKAKFNLKHECSWTREQLIAYFDIVLPGLKINIKELVSSNVIHKDGKTSNATYSANSAQIYAIKKMIELGLLSPALDLVKTKRSLGNYYNFQKNINFAEGA